MAVKLDQVVSCVRRRSAPGVDGENLWVYFGEGTVAILWPGNDHYYAALKLQEGDVVSFYYDEFVEYVRGQNNIHVYRGVVLHPITDLSVYAREDAHLEE